MKYYIEIIERKNNEVVERLDVTNESANTRSSIERGMNINLNRKEYFTNSVESENELEVIE